MGEPSAFHGAPRRIEALAYIMERIERTGTSPSYGEIGRGMRPHVTGSRVRQLVDQLVRIGAIERDVGSRRGIRIRDAHRCRVLIADTLGRHGWNHAHPLGKLNVHPCTNKHLPIIPLILANREVN
ncbi:SOS-response transcriptional repressor LexA [Sphingomonas sp. SORGH_AS802]|nr:SOS-response transcriptional repressor LexA [Sphingomonas sp. SORGH_AS_0438]MDR6136177.1 SOS-response transcriptional repressor LexA [Sphingomonas sp. SORGH_AS_0802]